MNPDMLEEPARAALAQPTRWVVILTDASTGRVISRRRYADRKLASDRYSQLAALQGRVRLRLIELTPNVDPRTLIEDRS